MDLKKEIDLIDPFELSAADFVKSFLTHIRSRQTKKAIHLLQTLTLQPTNHQPTNDSHVNAAQIPAIIDALSAPDRNGDTLLIRVCEERLDEIAIALIHTGITNIGHSSHLGTALFQAAINEMDDVVMALLQTGESNPGWILSDRDDDNDEKTALHILCENHMYREARALLYTGKGLPGHSDANGNTALHIATRLGMKETVISLIDTGQVIIGQVNEDGRTAFMEACLYGHKKIAVLLLETGEANTEQMDWSGRTALWYAQKSDLTAIVRLLRSIPEQTKIIQAAAPNQTRQLKGYNIKEWYSDQAEKQLGREKDRPAAVITRLAAPTGIPTGSTEGKDNSADDHSVQEWHFGGTYHRIGNPAMITSDGPLWFNHGTPIPIITPGNIFRTALQNKTAPQNKKSAFTYASLLYVGHAQLLTKLTAHGIPAILEKRTPIQLHIGMFAAPTESCYWPIHSMDDYRKYLEAYSVEFQEQPRETEEINDADEADKTKTQVETDAARVQQFFTNLATEAQTVTMGYVYGKEWLQSIEQTTQYPEQQMNWNHSHRYADKLYSTKEEEHGQTGVYIMANNIGIQPGTKILLPGKYMCLSEIVGWLERAGVTHLFMVDVSCSSVYHPETQKEYPDKWIRNVLNRRTIKLNRSPPANESAAESAAAKEKSLSPDFRPNKTRKLTK